MITHFFNLPFHSSTPVFALSLSLHLKKDCPLRLSVSVLLHLYSFHVRMGIEPHPGPVQDPSSLGCLRLAFEAGLKVVTLTFVYVYSSNNSSQLQLIHQNRTVIRLLRVVQHHHLVDHNYRPFDEIGVAAAIRNADSSTSQEFDATPPPPGPSRFIFPDGALQPSQLPELTSR